MPMENEGRKGVDDQLKPRLKTGRLFVSKSVTSRLFSKRGLALAAEKF
jgi:hypothetical protein